MTFAIISHGKLIDYQDEVFGYAPYVREMNLWLEEVDNVIIVSPLTKGTPTAINLAFKNTDIQIFKIPSISLTSFSEMLRSFLYVPFIILKIFAAMQKADHIHLRCPGNIGLLGCLIQIFFPKKPKTAKYAGNWDPEAKQPLSYKFQKWLLSNTFLTKNMNVLVYGEWPNQTKNITSFFTASYYAQDIEPLEFKQLKEPYHFLFVGSLVTGKRPMYAVKLVESLHNRGVNCDLTLYGEGVERHTLEKYINAHELESIVKLQGNKTAEEVKTSYKKSNFLLLPSKSEGWPKVVAEAMFWGVIPMVTPISCVPWMLDNGSRGVLLSLDLQKDTHTILEKIENTPVLKKMSVEARRWSQQYTLDSFKTEITKFLT